MAEASHPTAIAWTYDRAETVADGALHAIGVSAGLAGSIALLYVAGTSTHAVAGVSVAIYAIGLLSMLGFSAAYNVWPVSRTKWVLRRFDHSAIYVMIAGTYTPFVAQMQTGLVSAGLLIGVWVTAAVGVVLKLLLPGRFDRMSILLYVLLGWSGAAVCRPLAASLSDIGLWLLVAGGVLYTAGVAFHLWEKLRFHNAIWHGFVLVAACCHYSAIFRYVEFGRM